MLYGWNKVGWAKKMGISNNQLMKIIWNVLMTSSNTEFSCLIYLYLCLVAMIINIVMFLIVDD